jgi:serine/threonine protein kinase
MTNGGSVIESGGFGCIFKPQIKCNPITTIGEKLQYDKNGISKVMTSHNAISEYNEIKKYIPILKTIPNYKNYFLISQFSLCRPMHITKADLTNFDKIKCSSLKKKNITKKNINEKLDKLLMINMPYGGVDLDSFYNLNLYDITRMITFNTKMLELLNNAILPMNSRGIFHADLKANNILIHFENGNYLLRIIDWGLSTIYIPSKKVIVDTDFYFNGDWKYIPDAFRDRPFQFNVPFSCILFSSLFKNYYERFLSKYSNQLTTVNIYKFLRLFLMRQLYHRGSGHFTNIKSIFNDLYGTPDFITNIRSIGKTNRLKNMYDIDLNNIHYIMKYLTDILLTFTIDGKFDVLSYLNNVYIKNIDIWGYVMSFLPITEQFIQYDIIEKSPKTSKYEDIFHSRMKDMMNLLLKYSSTPINIAEVKLIIYKMNEQLYQLQENNILLKNLKRRSIESVKIRKIIKTLKKKLTMKVRSYSN